MRKLQKITILLLLMTLCLVAFAACNKLPTDDSGLKAQGFEFRVTFDGNGGRSGNYTVRMVYLKENSGIPPEGSTGIDKFVRAGYDHDSWFYEVEGDDGMPTTKEWDFSKEKVTKDHPGIEYNQAENLWELRLIPNWTKSLSYQIVCIADNGEVHTEEYPILRDNNAYQTNGFERLPSAWGGYTFLRNFDEDGNEVGTGYYYDEACTKEIQSYAELSPDGDAYPEVAEKGEGYETFRIYTKWLYGSYTIVKQASDFNGASDNYYFVNDIDFEGTQFTPFTRPPVKIIGNGHIIRNINATVVAGRTALSTGLFGSLSGSTVKDLILEDCTLNIEIPLSSGLIHRVGFIASSVTDSTVSGLEVRNGKINIFDMSENGIADNVVYNRLPEYFGAFNDVTNSNIDGFIADISIYDPDSLGLN